MSVAEQVDAELESLGVLVRELRSRLPALERQQSDLLEMQRDRNGVEDPRVREVANSAAQEKLREARKAKAELARLVNDSVYQSSIRY